jgi:hypothetical protein
MVVIKPKVRERRWGFLCRTCVVQVLRRHSDVGRSNAGAEQRCGGEGRVRARACLVGTARPGYARRS